MKATGRSIHDVGRMVGNDRLPGAVAARRGGPGGRGEPFRRALSYAIAVRDVVSTPLLGDEGQIDERTAKLLVTYRKLQ